MYLTLFKIAGFAAPAWALLIFLPTWRGTRWLARSAIIPAFLCVLYVIGIVALISASGFGFIRDFGSVRILALDTRFAERRDEPAWRASTAAVRSGKREAGYGLRITGYGLRVTGNGERVVT